MEILPVSDESLKKAAQVLQNGGIIAFPTETVYGLGADAYNADALVKVFEAKGRPRFDPLIIHICNIGTLDKVIDLSQLSEETKRKLYLLTGNFWPGPLSLVLPKNENIPAIATAGLNTTAVRLPANKAAQKLIKLAGGVVAAPSANPFGALSPTTAHHVKDGLGDKVDIILDGGAALVGIESTVLDLSCEQVRLLRHGGIPKEKIEKLIGAVIDASAITAAPEEKSPNGGLASPGQLKSHYAPRTPLTVFAKEEIQNLPHKENTAYLFFDNASREQFKSNFESDNQYNLWVLSSSGNISEAAACLFETLHKLDALGVQRIFAQLAPQKGLGSAINDRLMRASR
ncbi:MAG: threonylcarbamoyl-AMP synthase [Treponema sp.]|jgi:L-threonylcarbamoyladenylate synthase|nr:threonylcarbamoyl-AMP synthase [Treponema sp.]